MRSALVAIKAWDITPGQIDEGKQAESVPRGPRFPTLLTDGEQGFLFSLCTTETRTEKRKDRHGV